MKIIIEVGDRVRLAHDVPIHFYDGALHAVPKGVIPKGTEWIAEGVSTDGVTVTYRDEKHMFRFADLEVAYDYKWTAIRNGGPES